MYMFSDSYYVPDTVNDFDVFIMSRICIVSAAVFSGWDRQITVALEIQY